jgi:hypothetical protein
VRHVFLETNWLVEIAAPAHEPPPAAVELLNSARDGRIRIHVPACCIGEARKTIRSKFQPKEADRLRSFVRVALELNILDQNTAEAARMMLSRFESHVTSELGALNGTLRGIIGASGVEVLPVNDAVLDMSLELHFREVELSEFDRAVLAAVLINGRALRNAGEADVNFCTLDSNLWPWRKRTGQVQPELKKLYDDAGLRVYGDFTLATSQPS